MRSDGYGAKKWEDYDDIEIVDLLLEQYPLPSGLLWFLPWDCYNIENGEPPYLVTSSDLRGSVLEHDCDMVHDVVLIACDSSWVTLIHRDGAFFHFTVPEEGSGTIST